MKHRPLNFNKYSNPMEASPRSRFSIFPSPQKVPSCSVPSASAHTHSPTHHLEAAAIQIRISVNEFYLSFHFI